MEIIGRITANATVKTTKSDKEVVNFSIAINDRYKKDGEVVETVTFVNCAYWLTAKIAKHLTKGTVVQLAGRISVNAYKDMEGEAKASLNFHVNDIKFHGKPAGANSSNEVQQPTSQPVREEVADDLPF